MAKGVELSIDGLLYDSEGVPIPASAVGAQVSGTYAAVGATAGRTWIDITAAPYGADPTGAVANAGTALQSAITAAAALITATGQGATVYIPPGLYKPDIVPSLPAGLTAPLTILSFGATWQLQAGAPRFLDFNRTADYQTFQNINIEGPIVIDCNSVGGQHHVVLGTYIAGSQTPGQRLNFAHLRIRKVRTINVPVDATATIHRLNIFLGTRQLGAGEGTQNTITDILIEDCRFEGGNQGITIVGTVPSSVSGLNVYLDNIHVVRCWHSTLTAQASGGPQSHIQIGSAAQGGVARITDCYGYGSGDVGIETNALTDMIVRGTVMEDTNIGYYHVNYGAPLDIDAQTLRYDACGYRRTGRTTGRGWAFSGVNSNPLANIILTGCTAYKNEPTVADVTAATDSAIWTNANIASLTLDNFKAIWEGNSFGLIQAAATQGIIYIRPQTATCPVSIKNLKIILGGGRVVSAANTYGIRALALEGLLDLSVDGFHFSAPAVTNLTATAISVVHFGATNSTTVRGGIRRLSVGTIASGSTPFGARIAGTATLTVTRLEVTDSDFSQAPAGITELSFSVAGQNQATVFAYRNLWRTFPKPAAAITVTASPFDYQNLDGYAETVTVLGGTVSKVELSVDGTNYFDTGTIAGPFFLNNADHVRVTYTVAPTMEKLPAK